MKKEEKERLIKKLGSTKLKWPKGLKKYIFNETDYRENATRRARYVNTLEIFDNRLLMRTFAYVSADKDKRSYKNMLVQEVCRRLEGLSVVILEQIEAYGIYGNRIPYFVGDGTWITKRNRLYLAWYLGNKASWWFTYDAYNMFDVEEWIRILDILYCAYTHEKNTYKLPFFKHYEIYKRYPKIELLIKAGYSSYVPYVRYLNMNGKNFEQVFGIDKYWEDKLNDLPFETYKVIKKYQIKNKEELQIIQKSRIDYALKGEKQVNIKNVLKTAIYLTENKISSINYVDYLRFLNILGVDTFNRKVIFPKDFNKAHDNAEREAFALRQRIKDSEIESRGKELEKYELSLNGYLIIAPKTADEFISESKELNHCVRSYIDRYIDKETNIMFIRKSVNPKQPYVTLEFRNNQVIQVRRKNNLQPDDKTLEFVKEWAKKNRIKYVGGIK